ncbi:phenylpyruvate tautomerase PptA (4-oxalocrotonate tautomerase family) [Rhizobium leguminosarum]|uniref:Phenylpyruvate tautomerase PptA (4-oxalocrotonate tautomerase family) n=1 Tax=Rhizobium leguminosarum TaxID=384 RepID=A0AAE2SZH9_RHILE|nr:MULTISPECIES: tautomerase family protein [Rhizobium]MBB4294162.1 phenylpyruvate tautomerase PptA (4-oxalocrotonate tautomerase family) [Rhizobium leguminosarum]MBB4300658.1 phenylpyruvate tautomerase PptA (4-oxalocrotonate tautomerase family) [Rhizobium leguminosarum]MBB4312030.1 phenylpyruvate tautomerase PptA (4-oxalocrotonate tautomerase family) [Rhizobium leguminosarum]MBB4421000.1 phenylpyruvate tautomerase PptA (4-oxalocrotonate tautomerase family) [Rhizobium leguminosarum]MBB4436188.
MDDTPKFGENDRMPATRIETRRGWIGTRRLDVIEAVQRALLIGLKLPEDDRCIRLLEYEHDAMIVPKGRGPSYTVIEITLFSGRSLDAKRRLYAALAGELSAFDVPARDIKTILVEVPPENWGLRGLPASEINLGYKIDV